MNGIDPWVNLCMPHAFFEAVKKVSEAMDRPILRSGYRVGDKYAVRDTEIGCHPVIIGVGGQATGLAKTFLYRMAGTILDDPGWTIQTITA